MSISHEAHFEAELCEYLEAHGWLYSRNNEGYDRERGLFPEDVFAWLGQTAPDELAKVVKPDLNSTMQAKAKVRILDRLAAVMASEPINGGGTLNAIKKGFAVTPASFRMFQPQPADGLNPVTVERYGLNRVRVMRQVHYSAAAPKKALDLVLFLNGIAVATVELKTDMTQSAEDAIKQYKQDRNPKGEPLLTLGRGALVHFVVTNREVHMTTKLEGSSTRFLPFNAGDQNGAGNADVEGSSPTSYFWEKVLQKDAWLAIIGKFIHYRFEEDTDPITGKKHFKKSVRFPRYHQWRAVNALTETARVEGPGHNYLIQHSAGSGKTDSIAWTAYRLASLFTPEGAKVFDGVIVISDRNVLDGQLQKAIEQLETVKGVFAAITRGSEGAKSQQLAEALIKGRQIIGVTLQTFPHALEEIRKNKGLAGRKYAIIADEAHSSQSGNAAKSLKQVLTTAGMEDDEDISAEDVLVAEMSARAGETGQLSFFAFTATPKAKTVEMFGRPDGNGVPQVFDLYSMKQAIQEGFILDVLQNYTTYAMAVRIADLDEAGQSVEVELDKGSKALMQWVKLHPHNIAQKVAVIVEHFRSNVSHHLAGRAKAMVVTGSRREAVRYKKYMDEYIREHGYGSELATLVAFSGKIVDPELGVDEFTEHTMNAGLKGRSLTKAFGTDEFQVMIVANKFQTGFDQPLLVAMYVDKKLSGITAVQTLSRLNRVIPGKDQTFVLDFVNDPETILAAFQDYYEDAEIQDASNPDIIHDMVSKMDAMNIYNDRDVDLVAQKWVAQRNHNGLYSHLNPAVDVFNERMRQARADQANLAIGQLEEFQKTASAFNKAYDFFSQIINYQDTRIEKLAIYIKLLVKALSDKAKGHQLDLSDVVLTHYALKKIEDADLKLVDGQGQGLKGITGSGSGVAREKKSDTWAALIEKINKLFEGIGISDEDQINAISSIMVHAEGNEQLQREAQANGPIDFASSPSLPDVIEEAVYVAGEGHQKAINALLEMADAGKLVEVLLLGGLQQRLREKAVEVSELE